MTTQSVAYSGTQVLRERVAADIRAEIGRQRLSGSALARMLGKEQTWVSRRLRGEVAFDVDDLELITRVLGLDVAVLIGRRGNPTVAKDAPAGPTVAKVEPPVLRLVPSPRSRSVTRTSPTPPLMRIVASR